jgi:hypothetical protein
LVIVLLRGGFLLRRPMAFIRSKVGEEINGQRQSRSVVGGDPVNLVHRAAEQEDAATVSGT